MLFLNDIVKQMLLKEHLNVMEWFMSSSVSQHLILTAARSGNIAIASCLALRAAADAAALSLRRRHPYSIAIVTTASNSGFI